MKLTKTQIVLGSLGVAAVGTALFFTLTKKGKELREKWFGKKETTEPAGDPKTDTAKSDTIPPEDKGIAMPKPKMTLIEANALASLIRDSGGRMNLQGMNELRKRTNETRDKLEQAGYKMVKVKTGIQSFTFKAEPI